MGYWLILDAIVGEGIGTEELIVDAVKPLLADRYGMRAGKQGLFTLRHIGDPTGKTGDQSSISRSPVRTIRTQLGGTWRDGPIKPMERIEPLRSVLGRLLGGKGVVQVDRDRAAPVWQALRGGWHYHVARTGVIGGEAKKDIHSHPGDAMSYGAAVLFPPAKLLPKAFGLEKNAGGTSYFKSDNKGFTIGPPRQGTTIPEHGSKLILPAR